MFYNIREIKIKLCCLKCRGKLVKPKLLPCGYSICVDCEMDILLSETQSFSCSKCESIHQVPVSGLPTHMLVESVLETKPVKISNLNGKLYKNFENIHDSLEDLQVEIDNFESIIKSHCSHVKHEVDVRTKTIIEILKKRKQELHDEIEEFEKRIIHKGKQSIFNCNEFLDYLLNYKKQFEDLFIQALKAKSDSNNDNSLIQAAFLIECRLIQKKNLIDSFYRKNLLHFFKNEIISLDIGTLEVKEDDNSVEFIQGK